MVFGSGKNTGHLHNPPRFLHIHEKILEIPWVFFRFSPGFFPNRSGWHRQQTRPVASGSCGRVCGICVMDCPCVSSPRMGHVKAPWSDVPTHPPGHKNWFKCYPLVLTNIAMGNGTFIEVYIYIYILKMVIFHPNVGVCPTMIFLGTWKLVVGLLKRSSPQKKQSYQQIPHF